MRTIFLCLVILFGPAICQAQNNIFTHSIGDGFSSFVFFETNCASAIFTHGVGDGFDSEGFLESLTSGSSIFRHGIGDGFHVAHFNQTSIAISNSIFNHTEGDGFSFKSFIQPGGTSNSAIFQHSPGDGFSFATLTQSFASKNTMARVAAEVADEENSDEVGYSIFPNPSTGIFRVKNKNSNVAAVMRIQIYNMAGSLVFESFFEESEVEISLPANGLYLMHIVENKQVSYQRVIIARTE